MQRPSRWRALTCLGLGGALLIGACSPEAVRRRDGGPGGDGDNHGVQAVSNAKPHAADTTLWPGRAAAPVERLAAGTMPMPPRPAPPPAAAPAPSSQSSTPTAATPTDGRAFDKGKAANPRRTEPKKP